MSIREKNAYQPTLRPEGTAVKAYNFGVGKTIYSDDFGRCEVIDHPAKGERTGSKKFGLFYYRALNSIDVYSFKFQGNRRISLGGVFRAKV